LFPLNIELIPNLRSQILNLIKAGRENREFGRRNKGTSAVLFLISSYKYLPRVTLPAPSQVEGPSRGKKNKEWGYIILAMTEPFFASRASRSNSLTSEREE
jgi:hypothetical protein